MDRLKITILGCGSSGGVPRIGGLWGQCDPNNPKNRRRRCSILVERIGAKGTTTVLVDTSPDMREQLLDAQVNRLDGVIYTHAHADHVHGIDDLRALVIAMRNRLNVWADVPTQRDLIERFGYAFVQPEGSSYPPILNLNLIDGATEIEGHGGKIEFLPLPVPHGSITALGFRIGPVVYMPDVKSLTEDVKEAVKESDLWILDALRRDPHPSHIHFDGALDWIAAAQPKQAILTNMHIDLDYDTVMDETPGNVVPAFDGLVAEFDYPS